VIAISPLVAEALEKDHKVPKGKVRVVQNAVDLDTFTRRLGQQDREWMKQRCGIPKDSYVIGSVSRLVRDKGHEYLIEAVRTLSAEFPNVYLLVVGDGREREALTKQAEASIPGRFKLVPGVQDTTAMLVMMDVFCHPATWREGFGLSIAEAMVAKIPIVATDIPAINTLIKDGANGLVVSPKDADALAFAIRNLIVDPGKAKKFGQSGHETAVSVCKPERMADEIEAVYKEAAGAGK
jgi:glycosyltransferase involved in cell wall biosynthesis